MKIIFLLILYILCLSAISQTNIKLIDNLIANNDNNIYYSDLFSNVHYIPLETRSDNLIDSKCKVEIVDSFIIVTDLSSQYIFNLKDGKYLNQIGRKGKGPGEYRSAIGLINRNQKRIYSTGWNSNLLEYDFKGNFIGEINIPGYDDNFESPSIPEKYTIFEDKFVCRFMNCIGTERKLITKFDRNGKILNTISNSNRVGKQNLQLTINESNFYHYNNKLFFNEIYNDTIFEITDNCKIAKYIIDVGEFRMKYITKWKEPIEKWQNYILNMNIMESNQYVLLTYYLKGKLQISVFNKVTGKVNTSKYLYNDLDHFVSFTPLSIVDDNKIIGLIPAYEFVEWSNKNQTTPNNKLSAIKTSDNPLIVIAELK